MLLPSMRPLLAFLAALVLLSGCHTFQVEISDEPVNRVVYDRKAFFLWGLAPTREIDLGDHCPQGTVKIYEDTTFTDGLLHLITLGIYSPRSSWYHCAS